MKAALFYTPAVLVLILLMFATTGCPPDGKDKLQSDDPSVPSVYLWVDDGIGYWTRVPSAKLVKDSIVAVPCWQVLRVADDHGGFEPLGKTIAKVEKLPRLVPEGGPKERRVR